MATTAVGADHEGMDANTTNRRPGRPHSLADATSDWLALLSRLFVTVASVAATLAVIAFTVAIIVRVLT
jgi:hypothetical protein